MNNYISVCKYCFVHVNAILLCLLLVCTIQIQEGGRYRKLPSLWQCVLRLSTILNPSSKAIWTFFCLNCFICNCTIFMLCNWQPHASKTIHLEDLFNIMMVVNGLWVSPRSFNLKVFFVLFFYRQQTLAFLTKVTHLSSYPEYWVLWICKHKVHQ